MLAGGPLAAGEVQLLSRADPARAPDTPSGTVNLLVLSGDGRWIAFEDSAPNVVSEQSGPQTNNVFLFDRLSGATVLVSRAAGSATQGGNDTSGYPSISDDGATFISPARRPIWSPVRWTRRTRTTSSSSTGAPAPRSW